MRDGGVLRPKSETTDQASTPPRQLTIEWITQLWPSRSRARPAGRSCATRLGGPQAVSALTLLARQGAAPILQAARPPARAVDRAWLRAGSARICRV